jgi:hypothetical protein
MKKEVKMQEDSKKEKLIIRTFLILFIIAIFLWIIPSTIGFITLNNEIRAGELPQWLKDTSALNRAIIILIVVQSPYLLIALGLFFEFLNPNISLKYNRNKFLTVIAIIILLTGIFTLFLNDLSFKNGLYDTIIYGIGFGILFLLTINSYSIWMKILLWTRLIEFWGPLIGYDLIPAVFGRYTGGAFGNLGYGIKGMITNPYFLTDFIVSFLSVMGVMYLLKKAGFRWFWIISFAIGALIVGIVLTYIMPIIF